MRFTSKFNVIELPKVWGQSVNEFIQLNRIVLHSLYTQLEFMHIADNDAYCHYGFASIMDSIFIRPTDSNIKIPLIAANGIDYFPKRYYLDQDEVYYYSMFFEPLPPNTKVIDIVEDDGSSFGHHNMKLISLHKEHSKLFMNTSKN